jgi:hypothetical protein
MKDLNFVIEPRIGFGGLKFGQTVEQIVKTLGEAQAIDQIDDEDIVNTLIMHYWDIGTSIFFEGLNKPVVSCFETDNPDTLLFNEKVFDLDEEAITKIMKANGFSEIEKELEEGEKRLSFEDGLIDFFFINDRLIAVNWGVLVNDDGEIEDF